MRIEDAKVSAGAGAGGSNSNSEWDEVLRNPRINHASCPFGCGRGQLSMTMILRISFC